MTPEQVREYMLSKPEAEEDFPFYPDVSVMKVKGKMFATFAEEDGLYRMNLKCDPEQALELRDVFDSVKPGYHMNKKHWNTVYLDGELPAGELQRQIDHSYALVLKGMTKALRRSLETAYDHNLLYGEEL